MGLRKYWRSIILSEHFLMISRVVTYQRLEAQDSKLSRDPH
jgi:hypothetical protein